MISPAFHTDFLNFNADLSIIILIFVPLEMVKYNTFLIDNCLNVLVREAALEEKQSKQ